MADATGEVIASTDVSVVVCAYTDARMALLVSCLDAVLAQLSVRDELIVVIDHNPELFEVIYAQYRDVARVLQNTETRGLSGARNTGVQTATRDVIAFIDDDAQIQNGWLERMRSHYLDHAVAGVGGYASPVWPTVRPGWFPVEFDWVVGCSHRGLPEKIAPIRNFVGCNMSFRRGVFADVGRFNAEVGRVGSKPVGCEETELCIRISLHDPSAKLLYDPDLEVLHWVSEARVRPSYFLNRCFSEGLSKYKVSDTVGAGNALSSERRYVAKVLPLGFVLGLRDAITGRGSRRGAAARSLAIASGLAATALGYAYAMVQARWVALR